jgi:hypothetical protein
MLLRPGRGSLRRNSSAPLLRVASVIQLNTRDILNSCLCLCMRVRASRASRAIMGRRAREPRRRRLRRVFRVLPGWPGGLVCAGVGASMRRAMCCLS